jgi:hypothetical protein
LALSAILLIWALLGGIRNMVAARRMSKIPSGEA